MTTARFLLQVLDELSEKDAKRFTFFLKDSTEWKPIPNGRLENKCPVEMASLLVEHYGEQAAVITRKILLELPRHDLVKKMFEDAERSETEERKQAQRKRERPEGRDCAGSGPDPSEGEMSKAKKHKAEPLTDQKLMQLAGKMGHNWKRIGIEFLELKNYVIEQCESQNQHQITMQIFKMLVHWRNREKEQATAHRLHSILATKDCPISPEQFDCLRDENH
ncbi:pyrin-like [Heptranchias perlo]|uniref:pyrin-like n=1 Tax=Heptranchias perlo TaxID=212740 RepID=UPI003559AF3C